VTREDLIFRRLFIALTSRYGAPGLESAPGRRIHEAWRLSGRNFPHPEPVLWIWIGDSVE
jgi:hypothetical protein